MRIVLVLETILSVNTSIMAAAQTLGPLVSITPEEYLKLPNTVQTLYVAGVVDGTSVTSYGYSLPDHDAYVRCARTMTLGVLSQRVADWIRAILDFPKVWRPLSQKRWVHIASDLPRGKRA